MKCSYCDTTAQPLFLCDVDEHCCLKKECVQKMLDEFGVSREKGEYLAPVMMLLEYAKYRVNGSLPGLYFDYSHGKDPAPKLEWLVELSTDFANTFLILADGRFIFGIDSELSLTIEWSLSEPDSLDKDLAAQHRKMVRQNNQRIQFAKRQVEKLKKLATKANKEAKERFGEVLFRNEDFDFDFDLISFSHSHELTAVPNRDFFYPYNTEAKFKKLS